MPARTHADGRPTPSRRRPRRRLIRRCSAALLALLLALVQRPAAEGSIVNEAKTCFRPLSYPSHRQYELYDCSASPTTEAAISAMQTAANTSDGIVFNSVCSETAACSRLQPALDQVKAAIESAIVFDTPVYVNMTFLSFCKEAQSGQLAIDANCKVVLGAASPYLVPLQDDDGIQRMYPKALARQWGYASDGDPDIYAYFNSDAHWFYPQDTNNTLDQEDIVFVIAHELLHGLGFLSQWSSDGTKLYPMVRTDVVVTPSLVANEKALPKKFMGFTESAFDRLIGTTDPDPVNGNRLYLSDVAKQWIAAGAPLAGQPLENAGAAIDENGILSQLGVDMKLRSETAGALSVVDPGTKEAFLLLDTSFTPFLRGTSLTHVSQEKYWNATDALMVPTTRGGYKINPDNATVSDPLGGRGTKSSGSNTAVMYSGRVTLPHDLLVGPAIERVFSLMGYKTKNNPNPSNKPSLPSGTGVKLGNTAAAEGRPAGVFGVICAIVALVGLSW